MVGFLIWRANCLRRRRSKYAVSQSKETIRGHGPKRSQRCRYAMRPGSCSRSDPNPMRRSSLSPPSSSKDALCGWVGESLAKNVLSSGVKVCSDIESFSQKRRFQRSRVGILLVNRPHGNYSSSIDYFINDCWPRSDQNGEKPSAAFLSRVSFSVRWQEPVYSGICCRLFTCNKIRAEHKEGGDSLCG
jgi:hypothetical protein